MGTIIGQVEVTTEAQVVTLYDKTQALRRYLAKFPSHAYVPATDVLALLDGHPNMMAQFGASSDLPNGEDHR